MTKIQKLIYTGRTHTTGGRAGTARSDDGQLDVKLSTPGTSVPGTNPEQLFGAGWSSCFAAAIGLAAKELKVALPGGVSVHAEIDLGTNSDGYLLAARLNVSLPGLDREVAQQLVATAHLTCPYSKATRGNIDVQITLV
ncbi:organic hydroperoxide resistance protein [Azospirillum canadense]|uniref:organic hydroperoxide resistance protein n=1 Tax=Azospirillum canadense TaxID=403962 RepID=UPI002227086F|nr:organic hydroperoxide resistance protein [Azospirillum canadense]MCW2242448.1 Ohr subfamily peroxiredoxin [Azospirillum canadense]